MDSERLLVQTNDGRRNGIVYEFDEKARYRLILDIFHHIHTSSPRPRCLAFALLSHIYESGRSLKHVSPISQKKVPTRWPVLNLREKARRGHRSIPFDTNTTRLPRPIGLVYLPCFTLLKGGPSLSSSLSFSLAIPTIQHSFDLYNIAIQSRWLQLAAPMPLVLIARLES